MSGTIIARSLLTANPAITSTIPADRIIADDAFPQDIALPAILIRSTSTVIDRVVNRGARRHVTERVSIELHCDDNPTRRAMKTALRNAGDQKFPDRAGLENINVLFLGHPADGMSTTTFVRMSVTDLQVSYSEPAT